MNPPPAPHSDENDLQAIVPQELAPPSGSADVYEESPVDQEPEVDVYLPDHLPEAPATVKLASRKVSAFIIALLVHAALLALLGLIVVLTPEPPVSELTGYVMPSAQEQAPVQKVVPTMSTPPSPVSSSTQIMTAVGVSSVSLPEFEMTTEAPDMNIVTTDLGAGFSSAFAPKGSSQVNFFGIQSAGKRIMFLIDASKPMLTDSRGGYPAYEIVKNEIADMIGKMGLDTTFNVAMYDGNAIVAYSEKMMPATSANKAKIKEWMQPVNRDFEKLGLGTLGPEYPRVTPTTNFAPLEARSLSGYLRAIQFALESDVDTVFIINSGMPYIGVPKKEAEYQKQVKAAGVTEADRIKREAAVKAAQAHSLAWLAQENARRKKAGVPEKVISSWWQVVAESGFRWPAGIKHDPSTHRNATPEEREEVIASAVKLLYLEQGKPKPQINFVTFIGKEDDKDAVPGADHYKAIARKARNGKSIILQGLAGLKNVSGS